MSDLMRRDGGFLSPDDTLTSKTGGTLIKAGVGGGALWLAAGFIPLVSFPMLLILAIVLGLFMY